MKSEIFDDKNLQQYYINNWLNVLKEHDGILLNSFNTTQKINNFKINILASETDNEVFQQQMIFGDSSVFIHFRISPILFTFKKITIPDKDIKAIPLNDLINSESQFLWHDVGNDNNRPIKDPILIVPFLNGQYKYLVIDGNKRISSAMRQKADSINGIFLAEEYITEAKYFSSSFDKLFYIFNNELIHIGNQKHYTNMTDEELINLSILFKTNK
ncbi:hypothetical protein [Sporosarcina sp. A2]|uniref:hypothetical protein n=1 Tax=Sporosarcina sp. A2 TaxID=3393449 RepID=UPI003D796FBD